MEIHMARASARNLPSLFVPVPSSFSDANIRSIFLPLESISDVENSLS